MMNFDPMVILITSFFGVCGYAAWRYARRVDSNRHLILAIALMGYGLLTTTPWMAFLVGAVLTILLFWP